MLISTSFCGRELLKRRYSPTLCRRFMSSGCASAGPRQIRNIIYRVIAEFMLANRFPGGIAGLLSSFKFSFKGSHFLTVALELCNSVLSGQLDMRSGHLGIFTR